MWVITALAGLLGLTVLASCVPLYATFNIDTSEKPRFRLRLTWFFGLISKELHREKKKPEEKPKKKRRIESRTILKILRTEGLLKQGKNLVKGVLGQLKIGELAANLRLGLENPADVGFVFALIGPATSLLNLPARYRISVQPFLSDEPVFEGYLHGVLRLQPFKPVGPVLRFVFSPATLRALKTLILSKLKREK